MMDSKKREALEHIQRINRKDVHRQSPKQYDVRDTMLCMFVFLCIWCVAAAIAYALLGGTLPNISFPTY